MHRCLLPLSVLVFSICAYPATRTWDGGGADANWQTAANWSTDVAPAAGDDLVFPATAAQLTNNNNYFFLTSFNSITVDGGAYTFGGSPIRLVNGLTVNGGTTTINLAVTSGGSQAFTTATGATATVAVLSIGNFALSINGGGSLGIGLISGSGTINKNGLGAALIASGTGFSSQMNVQDGVLVNDAATSNSYVLIHTSTVNPDPNQPSGFGGTGSVGTVDDLVGAISSGTLTSPTGILNISGILHIYVAGTYVCKISGNTPGANGHDQLNVTGTVMLDGSRLILLPLNNFRPAIGDRLVIIKNDGIDPIQGTFQNLPEGARFAGPLNMSFQITYHGGDGNDVAVTRVGRAPFDIDGDGKTDTAVFRAPVGIWYELLSSDNHFASVNFGGPSDTVVPADFDGDNKIDLTVFRPAVGTWYSIRSSDTTFTATQFGSPGDIPVPNDFDGDGRADFTVFRPSTGVWYQLRSLGNRFYATQFGQNGDLPQVGDFDGDGIGDIAVYRAGIWYELLSSTGGFSATQFGIATDKPVPGDYDGDGKTDLAVYRDGIWYELGSSVGFQALSFGIPSDVPVAGDYDGDGKTDPAVYRNGIWYLQRSTSGFGAVAFGIAGDVPLPSAY